METQFRCLFGDPCQHRQDSTTITTTTTRKRGVYFLTVDFSTTYYQKKFTNVALLLLALHAVSPFARRLR